MAGSYRVLIDERDPTQPFTVTGELLTIPASESVSVARVWPKEIPLKETPSSFSLVSGPTTLTEITIDPSADPLEYRVIYKETLQGRWAGQIRLHSTHAGKSNIFAAGYKGIGSATIAQDITDIQNQKLDSDATFRQVLRSGTSATVRHYFNVIAGPGIGVSTEDSASQNQTNLIISTSVGALPPPDAAYIVGSLHATLTADRLLTAGSGITMVDAGANSTWTVSQTTDSVNQRIQGLQSNTSKGTRPAIDFIAGDASTHLKVTDNATTNRLDVLLSIGQPAGAPANITYVTMAADASLANARTLTAGNIINLVDGGANSTATISLKSGTAFRWMVAQEVERLDLASSSISTVLTLIHSAKSVTTGNTFDVDTGGTLPTSLIAYWKLDEISGNRADSKGSNTLTDNNTVTSTTGIVGSAGQFTAANSEYLSIADNTDLSVGDIDFSFAGWVYPTGANLTVIGKRVGADSQSEYYVGVTSQKISFNVWSTASVETAVTSTGSVNLNQWNFFACWHDSVNNQLGVQLNGATADTLSYTTGVRDGALQFVIGATSVPDSYFDGRIDEVGLWKKVLSATERTDLYNGGLGNTYHVATTTGFGVSGIGVGVVCQTEDSAGNLDNIGQIQILHATATSGSEDSEMRISLRSAGSGLVEWMRLSSAGLSVEREMIHIGDKNVGARGRFIKVYASNPANPPVGEVDFFVLDSGANAKVFKVRYNSSGTILETHQALT